MRYVEDEENYKKNIAGKCLERYDLLEAIENEIRGTLNIHNLTRGAS